MKLSMYPVLCGKYLNNFLGSTTGSFGVSNVIGLYPLGENGQLRVKKSVQKRLDRDAVNQPAAGQEEEKYAAMETSHAK